MSTVGHLVDRGSPSTSSSGTDVSEDSVEVRLQPISRPSIVTSCSAQMSNSKRNKRKSSEPRKLKDVWSSDEDKDDELRPAKVSRRAANHQQTMTNVDQPLQTTRNSISNEKGHFILNLPFDIRNILGPQAATLLAGGVDDEEDDDDAEDDGNRLNPRNYKNMTRERRIEANARERTRVHTISAAFENLRRAVPSYSCHQKLSKLAILRIACSYILALANLNDLDYSCDAKGQRQRQTTIDLIEGDELMTPPPTSKCDNEQAPVTFAQCVDLCTKTIQLEGKVRKRKG